MNIKVKAMGHREASLLWWIEANGDLVADALGIAREASRLRERDNWTPEAHMRTTALDRLRVELVALLNMEDED